MSGWCKIMSVRDHLRCPPVKKKKFEYLGRDKISNGLAPVNLIHLVDCIEISTQLIEGEPQTLTINAVSPQRKIVKSRYISALLGYTFKVDNWYSRLATATGLWLPVRS
jgi:hypothetical protein